MTGCGAAIWAATSSTRCFSRGGNQKSGRVAAAAPDLPRARRADRADIAEQLVEEPALAAQRRRFLAQRMDRGDLFEADPPDAAHRARIEIGRASFRESVWQYV